MLTASKRIAPKAVAGLLLAALSNFRVAAETSRKVISNLADLPFDENGHLSSHVLAYPASDPCSALVEAELPSEDDMYLHIPIAVEGDAADCWRTKDRREVVFGIREPDEGQTSSVCRRYANCRTNQTESMCANQNGGRTCMEPGDLPVSKTTG
jgi:hypothetical protein